MCSHIPTLSIMMDTITSCGTCTIIFGVLALNMPTTTKKVSHLSVVSFILILSAIMTTMIGVGVERPGIGGSDLNFAYTGMSKAVIYTVATSPCYGLVPF